MFCVDSCDLYFPNEMNQLFSACNSEPSMSFPCLSNPPNENTHGQRSAICAQLNICSHPLALTLKGIQLNLSINLATKILGWL
jgi:hypothetical protein